MIEYFEEIDSTNKRAELIGREGAENYSAVIAGRQTMGKGRKGRSWSSDNADGLYFSVIVRPQMDVNKVSMLTLVMAYSVSRFFADSGIDCQIKWPNDLIMNGKKICGILTELFFAENEEDSGSKEFFIVIGVGINFNNTSFNKELEGKATSVFRETGIHINVDDKEHRIGITEEILELFYKDCETVLGFGNLSPIIKKYNDRLVNINSRVKILDPKGTYEATALGAAPGGALIVRDNDGNTREITSGEVSVRGILGYVD